MCWRAARWRSARTALWRLLDRYVDLGDRVAVIGAGNADDLPLRALRRRADHVDLIDLHAAALRRAQRRLGTRRRALGMVVEDVTFGRADAITRATVNGHAPPPPAPTPRHLADPYDVVIADLLFTQLLYPALTDAGLPGPVIDSTMQRHGQPLTDAVVAWLHASAPEGLVIHVHDLLGWWPGHPQPFAVWRRPHARRARSRRRPGARPDGRRPLRLRPTGSLPRARREHHRHHPVALALCPRRRLPRLRHRGPTRPAHRHGANAGAAGVIVTDTSNLRNRRRPAVDAA